MLHCAAGPRQLWHVGRLHCLPALNCCAALQAREAPVNYDMWGTCIGVLTNASRFEGQDGDRLRAVLLDAGGR